MWASRSAPSVVLLGVFVSFACSSKSGLQIGNRDGGQGGTTGLGGHGGMLFTGGAGDGGHPTGGALVGGATGNGGYGGGGSVADGALVEDVLQPGPETWPEEHAIDVAIDEPAIDASIIDLPSLDVPAFEVEPSDTRTPVDLPIFQVGSCLDVMSWSQSIVDDETRGTGRCSGLTVGALIDQIRAEKPELADIERASPPNSNCWPTYLCYGTTDIKVLPFGDGFRVVMVRYAQFTMLRYHLEDYWYFETNDNCHPDWVGVYEFDIYYSPPTSGSPLWGYPSKVDCAVDGGSGLDASTRA